MIKIKELTQTCYACPSQWEGKTVDDRPIYVRYRWGYLSFMVGKKEDKSILDYKEIYGEQIGNNIDGVLSEEDMLEEVRNVAKTEL